MEATALPGIFCSYFFTIFLYALFRDFTGTPYRFNFVTLGVWGLN